MNYDYSSGYSRIVRTEEEKNRQKQNLLERLNYLNELCFDPSVNITQNLVKEVRDTLSSCNFYVVPPTPRGYDTNFLLSVYTSNNRYIDNPKDGRYLGDVEFEKTTGFIKNYLFDDRLLDLGADWVKKSAEIDDMKNTAFFIKQNSPNTYELFDRFNHYEVSFEKYLKNKLEQNIVAIEKKLFSIRYDKAEEFELVDRKLAVLKKHLEEVNQLDCFKAREVLSVQKERLDTTKDEITAMPVASTKRVGIDSLINNAKQRTNSNVTNPRTRTMENRSVFSWDYR